MHNIYVLHDGKNTKVGISADVDKRLLTYDTHNARYSVYATLQAPKDVAKLVEKSVKKRYADRRSGRSLEWFSVPPAAVLACVRTELAKCHAPLPAQNRLHQHTPLTYRAEKAKYEAQKELPEKGDIQGAVDARYSASKVMLSEFARVFALGLARHELPEGTIIADDGTPCYQNSSAGLALNCHRYGVEDGIGLRTGGRYYNIVHTENGTPVAFCSAIAFEDWSYKFSGNMQKIRETLSCAGFQCCLHNSWAAFRDSYLVISQKRDQADRLKFWDRSFKKFTIENSARLSAEGIDAKVIADITRDGSFPLEIKTHRDLSEYFDWIGGADREFSKGAHALLSVWATEQARGDDLF